MGRFSSNPSTFKVESSDISATSWSTSSVPSAKIKKVVILIITFTRFTGLSGKTHVQAVLGSTAYLNVIPRFSSTGFLHHIFMPYRITKLMIQCGEKTRDENITRGYPNRPLTGAHAQLLLLWDRYRPARIRSTLWTNIKAGVRSAVHCSLWPQGLDVWALTIKQKNFTAALERIHLIMCITGIYTYSAP